MGGRRFPVPAVLSSIAFEREGATAVAGINEFYEGGGVRWFNSFLFRAVDKPSTLCICVRLKPGLL